MTFLLANRCVGKLRHGRTAAGLQPAWKKVQSAAGSRRTSMPIH